MTTTTTADAPHAERMTVPELIEEGVQRLGEIETLLAGEFDDVEPTQLRIAVQRLRLFLEMHRHIDRLADDAALPTAEDVPGVLVTDEPDAGQGDAVNAVTGEVTSAGEPLPAVPAAPGSTPLEPAPPAPAPSAAPTHPAHTMSGPVDQLAVAGQPGQPVAPAAKTPVDPEPAAPRVRRVKSD